MSEFEAMRPLENGWAHAMHAFMFVLNELTRMKEEENVEGYQEYMRLFEMYTGYLSNLSSKIDYLIGLNMTLISNEWGLPNGN